MSAGAQGNGAQRASIRRTLSSGATMRSAADAHSIDAESAASKWRSIDAATPWCSWSGASHGTGGEASPARGRGGVEPEGGSPLAPSAAVSPLLAGGGPAVRGSPPRRNSPPSRSPPTAQAEGPLGESSEERASCRISMNGCRSIAESTCRGSGRGRARSVAPVAALSPETATPQRVSTHRRHELDPRHLVVLLHSLEDGLIGSFDKRPQLARALPQRPLEGNTVSASRRLAGGAEARNLKSLRVDFALLGDDDSVDSGYFALQLGDE